VLDLFVGCGGLSLGFTAADLRLRPRSKSIPTPLRPTAEISLVHDGGDILGIDSSKKSELS